MIEYTYNYVLYLNNKIITTLKSFKHIKSDAIVHNGIMYKFNLMLEPIYLDKYQYIVPCIVEKVGEVKYKWVASCDDGAFNDESKKVFITKEECYNDMRNSALEKMKWNTEYKHDFDCEDDSIGYEVSFSQNKIVHKSYSGTYTYKIVECITNTN